jgi:hypothetical protein
MWAEGQVLFHVARIEKKSEGASRITMITYTLLGWEDYKFATNKTDSQQPPYTFFDWGALIIREVWCHI